MQSYLIIGEAKEERFKRALKMARKWPVEKLDKIILQGENSIGIDSIRNLQHQLSLKPYSSSYKIAILPNAEKLTIQAQNAMLKLLEEPPKDTIIILSSPTPEVLLPTVISRCQIVRLPAKPQEEIDKEMINSQLLILDSILKAGVGERIKIADEIAKNREEGIRFCQAQLIIWRRKMIQLKSNQKKAQCVKTIHLIQQALKMLEANVNPKLTLENLLLSFPIPDRLTPQNKLEEIK